MTLISQFRNLLPYLPIVKRVYGWYIIYYIIYCELFQYEKMRRQRVKHQLLKLEVLERKRSDFTLPLHCLHIRPSCSQHRRAMAFLLNYTLLLVLCDSNFQVLFKLRIITIASSCKVHVNFPQLIEFNNKWGHVHEHWSVFISISIPIIDSLDHSRPNTSTEEKKGP